MIEWLFKFNSLPEGGTNAVGWMYPWPLWAWILSLFVIFSLSIWSYRKIDVVGLWKLTLPLCRSIILILILILLNGPVIETSKSNKKPDQVLFMIDRSGSMEIPDVRTSMTSRITREDHVNETLESIRDGIESIQEDRSLKWFGFHGHAYEKPNQDNRTIPIFDESTGRNTRIGYSIDQAISMSSGVPISSIILFTDGRSHGNTDQKFISKIRSEGVPIITVPIGSVESTGDLAITQVVSPRVAFTDDRVPVQVYVDRRGSFEDGFEIKLIDRKNGRELDRIHVDSNGENEFESTLLGIPDEEGTASWSIVIEPGGPDLVIENNSFDIDINLQNQPLKVLYVEGVPRWEYRYLKNILLREESIESSIMLLSADRSFAQEGDRPISRLPVTADEFDQFDVMVIGDVPSSIMSPDQHLLLQEAVADGRMGVLWIGGKESTPRTWAKTRSSSLIPFSEPFDLPSIGSAIQIQPTEEARRIGVLRINDQGSEAWPDVLVDENTDWSKFQWAQWIQDDKLKPTSSVLAETVRLKDGDTNIPIVVDSRFGLGRSIYVATDEIWRWRYGRGERLGEQFWIQLIRTLGRESRTDSTVIAQFRPSRRQLPSGQIVRLDLNVMDESVISNLNDSLLVTIRDRDGFQVSETTMRRDPSDQDTWNGSWMTTDPGEFELTISTDSLDVSTSVRVEDSSDEYRKPEVDHEYLAELSEITNGYLVRADEVDEIFKLIPDRSVTEIDVRKTSLWDAPIVFLIIMLLLCIEWIGRRIQKMA